MPLLSHDRAHNAELLMRARSLRLHARDILHRSGVLRHRADRLLAVSGDLRVRVEMQRTVARRPVPDPALDAAPVDDAAADERAWYRAQVRQMLDSGWTRAQLADVGVTDGLLEDLGLEWPADRRDPSADQPSPGKSMCSGGTASVSHTPLSLR